MDMSPCIQQFTEFLQTCIYSLQVMSAHFVDKSGLWPQLDNRRKRLI
jgi:hypothetical protein